MVCRASPDGARPGAADGLALVAGAGHVEEGGRLAAGDGPEAPDHAAHAELAADEAEVLDHLSTRDDTAHRRTLSVHPPYARPPAPTACASRVPGLRGPCAPGCSPEDAPTHREPVPVRSRGRAPARPLRPAAEGVTARALKLWERRCWVADARVGTSFRTRRARGFRPGPRAAGQAARRVGGTGRHGGVQPATGTSCATHPSVRRGAAPPNAGGRRAAGALKACAA